ncbi:MAG: hypothetical protein DRI23_11430, partial [Candidatus Cloacimonadota bacterium]
MNFPAHMYNETFSLPKYVTKVILDVDHNASVGDYTGMMLKIGNEEHRISAAHRITSDELVGHIVTIDNDLPFPAKLNYSTGEYEVNTPFIRELFENGWVGESGNSAITINLGNGSEIDDFYNGMTLRIASSNGWGNNEEHKIIDYNGTTKIATVDGNPAWHLSGTPGYFIYDNIAYGDIAYCDTLSGFEIQTDVSNNEADFMIVYNLADSLDYVWNDSVWVVNEYPELHLDTNSISHILNMDDTVNYEVTVSNVGGGTLNYSADLMICADSTFIDSLGDMPSGFDIKELRCGIDREGFISTIETNGSVPMGFIFIDADCNAGTGMPWVNDGENLPFGGDDVEMIRNDFPNISRAKRIPTKKRNVPKKRVANKERNGNS